MASSLPQARKDSNAPDGSGDNAPSTGEAMLVGFTEVPYQKFRPAKSNADVPSTKDNSAWSLGQDGTSAEAYEHQPMDINTEKPDFAKSEKGQEK
jgi:hypothetical protein